MNKVIMTHFIVCEMYPFASYYCYGYHLSLSGYTKSMADFTFFKMISKDFFSSRTQFLSLRTNMKSMSKVFDSMT